ncbi:MAG: glycerophosphodiester phosphodiesterase family protein [Actinomycetota bacterium]
MNTSWYFEPASPGRPRILAHRGFTYSGMTQIADENTLRAFELALSMGADYLETDIQLTKDAIPVLYHDGSLKRLTGKETKVSKLSWNELRAISLPHGGSIPSLEEALKAFPEAKFNLDLKTPFAVIPATNLIANLQAENRVLLSSFSEQTRLSALARFDYPVATSPGSSKVIRIYAQARFKNNLSNLLAGVNALQVPISAYGIDFTHPSFVEKILEENKELHYWTINDPHQMQKLFSLGATGIVTDRTDLAIAAFS